MPPMPWPSRSAISRWSKCICALGFPRNPPLGSSLAYRPLSVRLETQHALRSRASNQHDEILPFSRAAALVGSRGGLLLWLLRGFVSNTFFPHSDHLGIGCSDRRQAQF